MKKEYTLYKGETVIAAGTMDELSKQLDVKKRTLVFYKTPSNLKRDKGNRRVLVES